MAVLRDSLEWIDTWITSTLEALRQRGLAFDDRALTGLRPLIRQVVEAVLRDTRRREVVTPDEYEELATTCRRYALDRALALDTVRVAAEHTWQQLLQSSAPSERSQLFDALERLLRLVDVLQRAVTLAYIDAGTDDTALVADDAPTLYGRQHRVQAVATLPRLDPQDGAGSTRGPAGRHRRGIDARRLRRRLGHRASVMELDDVVILLLSPIRSSLSTASNLTGQARQLVAGLELETPAGLAISPAGGQLSAAIAEACEILWTVVALDYEPRLYEMDEVVLEILLCRSPDIARKMEQRLRPLQTSGTELLDTLREVLDGTGERRVTAGKLCIHPNTLAYRLRRITELTSLSVSHPPRDQWLLRIALTSMTVLDQLDDPATVAVDGNPAG